MLSPLLFFFRLSIRSDWYPPVLDFFPATPTLANFESVISNPVFARPLVNTIIVSLSATTISLALATLSAYGFARFPFKRSNDIAFWILSLRLVPPVVTIIPIYITFVALKMVDTYPAIILTEVVTVLPFAIWLLRSFFLEVPVQIEEAAMVDGASRLRAFVTVVLPLAAPGMVATWIFSMIFCWNEFMFALVLAQRNTMTMPVSVLMWYGSLGMVWGPAAAQTLLATIPLFIFIILVQKYLIRGLSLGALQ